MVFIKRPNIEIFNLDSVGNSNLLSVKTDEKSILNGIREDDENLGDNDDNIIVFNSMVKFQNKSRLSKIISRISNSSNNRDLTRMKFFNLSQNGIKGNINEPESKLRKVNKGLIDNKSNNYIIRSKLECENKEINKDIKDEDNIKISSIINLPGQQLEHINEDKKMERKEEDKNKDSEKNIRGNIRVIDEKYYHQEHNRLRKFPKENNSTKDIVDNINNKLRKFPKDSIDNNNNKLTQKEIITPKASDNYLSLSNNKFNRYCDHIEVQSQFITDNNSKLKCNKDCLKSYDKDNKIIKTLVKHINLECVTPNRAGIIMYTVFENRTYFGLGLDSKSHDLTDFGGRVIYKVDSNAINGALREFNEETLNIFNPLTLNDIKDCPVIYDNKNLIIFMYISLDPNIICHNFNNNYKIFIKDHNYDPEVCGITWLTWEEFQNCINTKGILFSRVQKFLSNAHDFSYLL